MTSILQGSLAKQVYNAFKADGQIPITGTLRRETATGQDAYGDPIYTPTTYSFDCFISDYSDFTRAQAGIPQEDRKVNIWGASCSVVPQKGDKVNVPGYGWLQIRTEVKADPAKALYECQSYKVEAPS